MVVTSRAILQDNVSIDVTSTVELYYKCFGIHSPNTALNFFKLNKLSNKKTTLSLQEERERERDRDRERSRSIKPDRVREK